MNKNMMKVQIVGHGLYAPGEPISNEEIKKLAGIDFDSNKIGGKLGIYNRHVAKFRGLDETTADFATKATIEAIKDAGLRNEDINLFVVGTDTPEYISPATSLLVQGRLQKGETFGQAFDVNASCASFTTALDMAIKLMHADETIKYAVVVGVYNMSQFIREGDTFGHSIFADGAGSVVLKRGEDSVGVYHGGQFLVDGTQWDYLGVYAGGCKRPVTQEVLNKKEYGLQLIKPLPGDRNVKLWPVVINKCLEKCHKKLGDIDHIIFTQINKHVIEEVIKILGFTMEKTTCIMDRYGYTGSGCVPMALYHAVKDKKIKRGDNVMLVASGAGLEVGCNFFTY